MCLLCVQVKTWIEVFWVLVLLTLEGVRFMVEADACTNRGDGSAWEV